MSYNQPKLCFNATWDPSAITFTNSSFTNTWFRSIFVHANNTVFTVSGSSTDIFIWANNSMDPTAIISANLNGPQSLFVTDADEILVYSECNKNGVERWTMSGMQLGRALSMSTSRESFDRESQRIYSSLEVRRLKRMRLCHHTCTMSVNSFRLL
jgi:hypothetical protein